MDPQIAELTTRLAEVAVRNTASVVSDRIRAAKAQRKDRAVIAEMDEIITSLINDKNEAIQIAQALDEKFVAQRISDEELTHVTNTLVPIIEKLAEAAEVGDAGATIELLKPVLSAETLKVLQALGFNFKQAIGEPLTALLRALILKQSPDPETDDLKAQQQIESMRLALDPEAFARFYALWGIEQSAEG